MSSLDPRTTTPVSDLSETGVFVHTDDPLPIGSSIELRFTAFPDQPVLFEGQGRVVRHNNEHEPPGMGVEFVDLDPGAKDVLGKILLRDEAARRRPSLAKSDDVLRTHGLVFRLLEVKPPGQVKPGGTGTLGGAGTPGDAGKPDGAES